MVVALNKTPTSLDNYYIYSQDYLTNKHPRYSILTKMSTNTTTSRPSILHSAIQKADHETRSILGAGDKKSS